MGCYTAKKTKKRYLTLVHGLWSIVYGLTLLCVTSVYGADTKPEITAEVDRDKVNIGDRVRLSVYTREVKGTEFVFPDPPERMGDFSWIGCVDIKTSAIKLGVNGGRSRLRQGFGGQAKVEGKVYVLGIYSTGTHIIPPVEVKYKAKGALDWSVVETKRIQVEVKSVLKGDEKDIRDLKGLMVFRTRLPRIVLVIAGLLLLGALIAAFLYLRKKYLDKLAFEADNRAPHEVAFHELARLKSQDLPKSGMVKEYYIRLSGIIRYYLEKRFNYKAPEMTTEEFIDELRRSPELVDEIKTFLKRFLEHCDMVKFAKYGPTALEMIDSYKLAEKIVERTIPAPSLETEPKVSTEK
ncbi:MAG: hypothetical protein HQL30_12730 [Candidatus Omnitrophica bacterium]|nr:hypothetical protein [Candidatus Omnitrophota bacterium]